MRKFQIEQRGGSTCCKYIGMGRPYLNVLEAFDPNLQSDPFNWIPQGLFQDLKDNRNDVQFNYSMVDDQVSGYTNQQMFNAFQSNITSLQDYRLKLLQLNNNNQLNGVNSLFSQYGY